MFSPQIRGLIKVKSNVLSNHRTYARIHLFIRPCFAGLIILLPLGSPKSLLTVTYNRYPELFLYPVCDTDFID